MTNISDDDAVELSDIDEEEEEEDERPGEHAARAQGPAPTQQRTGDQGIFFNVSDDSLEEEDLHIQARKQQDVDAKQEQKEEQKKKKKMSVPNTNNNKRTSASASTPNLSGINEYFLKKNEREGNKKEISADQQFLMGLLDDFETVDNDVKAMLKCSIITNIDQARKRQGQYAPSPPPPPAVQQPLPMQNQATPTPHHSREPSTYIRGHYGPFNERYTPTHNDGSMMSDLNGINVFNDLFPMHGMNTATPVTTVQQTALPPRSTTN